MPAVAKPLRKARAARLRAAGERAVARFLESQVGRTAEVLIEKPGFGRTEHFAPVALDGGAPGEIQTLRLTAVEDGRLVGTGA